MPSIPLSFGALLNSQSQQDFVGSQTKLLYDPSRSATLSDMLEQYSINPHRDYRLTFGNKRFKKEPSKAGLFDTWIQQLQSKGSMANSKYQSISEQQRGRQYPTAKRALESTARQSTNKDMMESSRTQKHGVCFSFAQEDSVVMPSLPCGFTSSKIAQSTYPEDQKPTQHDEEDQLLIGSSDDDNSPQKRRNKQSQRTMQKAKTTNNQIELVESIEPQMEKDSCSIQHKLMEDQQFGAQSKGKENELEWSNKQSTLSKIKEPHEGQFSRNKSAQNKVSLIKWIPGPVPGQNQCVKISIDEVRGPKGGWSAVLKLQQQSERRNGAHDALGLCDVRFSCFSGLLEFWIPLVISFRWLLNGNTKQMIVMLKFWSVLSVYFAVRYVISQLLNDTVFPIIDICALIALNIQENIYAEMAFNIVLLPLFQANKSRLENLAGLLEKVMIDHGQNIKDKVTASSKDKIYDFFGEIVVGALNPARAKTEKDK